MSRLTNAERDHLPDSAFVFPEERAFPIPDRANAYDALRDAKEESPERAEAIRVAVLKEFNIGRSGAQVR